MATDPSVFPQGLVSGPRLQHSTCEQVASLPVSAQVTLTAALPGTGANALSSLFSSSLQMFGSSPSRAALNKGLQSAAGPVWSSPALHFFHSLPRVTQILVQLHWGKRGNSDRFYFIFLGSKITTDGGCSHEIKRCLLLGRKGMTNLDSVLQSRDINLPTNVRIVKATVLSVVMYRCESWTIKKVKWKSLNCVWLFVTPWDYTVHGILQARILEWVPIPFSRGSSQPMDQAQVSHTAGRFFTSWATREAQEYWSGVAYPFSSRSSWPRTQTGNLLHYRQVIY